jgi:hypothetical protein
MVEAALAAKGVYSPLRLSLPLKHNALMLVLTLPLVVFQVPTAPLSLLLRTPLRCKLRRIKHAIQHLKSNISCFPTSFSIYAEYQLKKQTGPFSTEGATTMETSFAPNNLFLAYPGHVQFIKYCPVVSGDLTVDLCGSEDFDTYMYFLQQSGSGSTIITENDDFCGDDSGVETHVEGGHTYFIGVGGYMDSTGNYHLNTVGPASDCGGDLPAMMLRAPPPLPFLHPQPLNRPLTLTPSSSKNLRRKLVIFLMTRPMLTLPRTSPASPPTSTISSTPTAMRPPTLPPSSPLSLQTSPALETAGVVPVAVTVTNPALPPAIAALTSLGSAPPSLEIPPPPRP